MKKSVLRLTTFLMITALCGSLLLPLRAYATETTEPPYDTEENTTGTVEPGTTGENADEPDPTMSPEVAGGPEITEFPEITEPPVITGFPAPALEPVFVEAFEQTHAMNSFAGVLLTDLTSGELLASKNAFMLSTASELNEWMLLLFALRNTAPDTVVTITAAMLSHARSVALPVLFGFKEGDTVTMDQLLRIFLMTGADDARAAIAGAAGGTEARAVAKMNQVTGKIGMQNSFYLTTDGAYQEGQYTTAYDLYLLFRELMSFDSFADSIGRASMRLSYTTADGTVKTVNCRNMGHQYSNLYGEAMVPAGYQFLARFSGGAAASGLAQVLLATGTDGHIYLTVLTGIPFEKDISIESHRLLELRGQYYDAKQELPLGDDTVRYKYLLGTGVTYFTVDNKAPGYANAAEADRYMMEVTLPVWKLNSDGSRTASSMKMLINRKLVTSVREIFQEIYELPMQFPIKVLKGYGYRKSGGVGLSNCTLMSIHSYGAALDINPGDYDNDYYLGAGNDLRDKSNPYCIPEEVIQIFEKHGWFWGGDFAIAVDSMHFQYLGLDYLTYQNNSPFRTLSLGSKTNVGTDVENLQKRLNRLGYRTNQNGIYTVQTRLAVMKFQTRQGLPVTGEVDYKTWETLINITHDMAYAF